MDLVIGLHCKIRNFTVEDKQSILMCRNLTESEVDKLIEENKDITFTNEGKKCAAIVSNEKIIGELVLDIKPLQIELYYEFCEEHKKRITIVDMLVSVIRQTHKTFPYKEILCYASKLDFEKRSILESLNFERYHLDKENNLYTYRLYRANPIKDLKK